MVVDHLELLVYFFPIDGIFSKYVHKCMARKQRTRGSVWVILVLLIMVYPSRHITDKFTNLPDKERLGDALAIGRETKTINS